VYVYFNNTRDGHAVHNARTLLALLGSHTAKPVGRPKDKAKSRAGSKRERT
jgi:uncharacterized protein YecE (DUF72 family)